MRGSFNWGSQIWHIIPFPNNSFNNPCCVPGDSLSNPMKIPDGAYIVRIWQAIPWQKHLDQVFACLTNALTFLQPCPYLFPLYFRNIPTSLLDPGSFPDRAHIFPRSFPILPPPPSFPKFFPPFSFSFPKFFPTSSHGFPRSFPVLSPPLMVFLSMFFQTYSIVFPDRF